MKCTIIINKKEYIRDLPTSWDQVTFEQFLQLDSCGDDIVKAIALLTRLDYDQLLKAKIVGMDNIVAVLGFLKTEAKPVLPKVICGYPVPKDLEFEQVQMYVDLKNYIKESETLTPIEKLAKYTVYCAVYACSHKHGKYDWKLSEEMATEFLHAPCTEVMGIGNFTLARLIGLNLNINLTSQKAVSRMQRFKLALKLLQIRLGSRLRWFFWKRRLV